MPPKTQVNSATGIMGVSGTGKSSLAATFAKYIQRRWGKVLLYYTSDGGGFPAEVQACIAAGLIRVFRMRTRDTGDLSFETCYRSCQGWWPKRITPSTGEVPPGVEMVPPIAVQFAMHCAQGHLVKTVPSESLLTPCLCPTCKTPVTKQDMRVTKAVVRNKGFEDVGGVFYDGLTSMLSWEMLELGHRAGRMELKGEEGAIGGKVTSGDLKFGGSTRSHVGFAQARGEELVHLTLGIPGLVVPPIFTMLTHEDVDERSLSIIGPKIAGRAKTDEAPQWFGNMLETAKVPAELGNGTQRTLYLQEFTDNRGVRHLLKHRGSPGTMPAMLQDPAEGETNPDLAFTQFNLGVFFEMLEAALDRRIADVLIEFPNAPGVPEGMVEIGGATMSVQPGPAAPAPAGVPPPAPAPIAPAPKRRAGTASTAVPPTAHPVVPPPVPPEPVPAALPVPAVPAVPAVPVVLAPPSASTTTGPLAPVRPSIAPPPGRRPSVGVAGVQGPGAPRPTSVTPRMPAAAPHPPTLPLDG